MDNFTYLNWSGWRIISRTYCHLMVRKDKWQLGQLYLQEYWKCQKQNSLDECINRVISFDSFPQWRPCRKHQYYKISQSMYVVGYASEWQFPVLCSSQSRHKMLSKQSFYDRHYGLILDSLIVPQFGVTTFHLLSIPTMCSPYLYMFISSWNNTERM